MTKAKGKKACASKARKRDSISDKVLRSCLDNICDKLDTAKENSSNNRVPYGEAQRLIDEMKKIVPVLSKNMVNYHSKKRESAANTTSDVDDDPDMPGLDYHTDDEDSDNEDNENGTVITTSPISIVDIISGEELHSSQQQLAAMTINTVENTVTGATLAIRNNLPFLKQPFPTIKNLVHDRWLAINLAETNSIGILEDKLIRYRIHSAQAIGGMTKNIEKYIDLNTNLLEGTPNINNSISSFKDLRYILNKIETNLQIQNEFSKIETKSFDNTKYIAILKNKHKIYLEYGYTKWPLLSYLRKFKKLFIA
jgi:hypothetical protein